MKYIKVFEKYNENNTIIDEKIMDLEKLKIVLSLNTKNKIFKHLDTKKDINSMVNFFKVSKPIIINYIEKMIKIYDKELWNDLKGIKNENILPYIKYGWETLKKGLGKINSSYAKFVDIVDVKLTKLDSWVCNIIDNIEDSIDFKFKMIEIKQSLGYLINKIIMIYEELINKKIEMLNNMK